MSREVLSRYDIMTVGELNHVDVDQMLQYSHPDRKEIQMGFTFEHVNLGRGGIDSALKEPHKLSEFKKVLAKWQTIRDRGAWHALYLENHDQVSDTRKTSVTVLIRGSLEVSPSTPMMRPSGVLSLVDSWR